MGVSSNAPTEEELQTMDKAKAIESIRFFKNIYSIFKWIFFILIPSQDT